MDRDEMIASVEEEIGRWLVDAHPYAWNTGPGGRQRGKIDYGQLPEISREDFDAAVSELKRYVSENIARHSGRDAASFSGSQAGYNVWSFLIEPFGGGDRKFNYHIRVAR